MILAIVTEPLVDVIDFYNESIRIVAKVQAALRALL